MKRLLTEVVWIRGICEALAFIGWAGSTTYAVHQSAKWLLTGVALYLAFSFLRVYIDHLKQAARLNPKESALRELLRLLTTALFDERPGYRTTLLLPDSQNQHLLPVYRYQYGGPSGRCKSQARFPKGVAFAGLAWQSVKVPFKKGDIPDLSGSDDVFMSYYMREFRMSAELVQNLSDDMRKVRSIFCIGLVDHKDDFIAVLSLDSVYPDAFELIAKPQLDRFVAALEATLEEP